MLTMRREASRTVANASSMMSSSDAPLSSFCLNSAVLPRSSASDSVFHFGSRSLTRCTRGRSRLISRSWLVPKTFLMIPPMAICIFCLGSDEGRSLARLVLGDHHSMDAAADHEIAFHTHASRVHGGHQVIQYAIGHSFMEGAFITKGP